MQGVALCAAIVVGWYQIRALRREAEERWENERAWSTLKACEKYDTDLVLTNALIKLRDARNVGLLLKNPRDYSLEMTTILNYLEGMIIGIEQGFYKEEIVRDHMEPIIRDHVREFLSGAAREVMVDKDDNFSRLTQKLTSWTETRTRFTKEKRK